MKVNREIDDTNDDGSIVGIVMGFLFLAIGLVLIIISSILFLRYTCGKSYIEIKATVIDHSEKLTSEGNIIKSIVIEYKVNDVTYRKKSGIYSSNPKKIGSTVLIKYNSKNPEKIKWNHNEASFGLLVFGLAIATTALFLLFVTKYDKKGSKGNYIDGTLKSDKLYSSKKLKEITNKSNDNEE